jgi:excisionase family DNA binding protein
MTEEIGLRLLTVKQACTYLNISHTTLYRMIERKEIAPVIIGGRTLFDKSDLDELIEKAKTPGERPPSKRGRKRKVPH